MKKIVLVSLSLLLSAAMLSPIVSLAESNTSDFVNENVSQNDEERAAELEKFSIMQDNITSVLKVENEKYVYDKAEVKAIVEDFDFDSLAKETGIQYTSESFLQEAITNIENTTLKSQIQPRNGNSYNRNYYEEGWNYSRIWMDTKETKLKIKDLLDGADYVAAGGLVGDLFSGAAGLLGFVSGPIAGALMLGTTVGGAGVVVYFQNMARNLEYKNNGTGTVLEVNKFVMVYSCWSQNEYKGK